MNVVARLLEVGEATGSHIGGGERRTRRVANNWQVVRCVQWVVGKRVCGLNLA